MIKSYVNRRTDTDILILFMYCFPDLHQFLVFHFVSLSLLRTVVLKSLSSKFNASVFSEMVSVS